MVEYKLSKYGTSKTYYDLDSARRGAVAKMRRNKADYLYHDEFVTVFVNLRNSGYWVPRGYAGLDYNGKPIWCEAGKSVYRHKINKDGSISERN